MRIGYPRTGRVFRGLSTDPMNIAVLHNPSAGDREFSRREVLALLRDAGYRPKYFSLKEDAWRQPGALRAMDFVVVAGGDGAVRKAMLQLHDAGLPLALWPLGTANNICTSLGIAGPPEKIVASWSRARRRKLDLGLARGPWGEELFVESAGVGLFGRAFGIMDAMAEATEHRLKRRQDRLHHSTSVIVALAHELRPVALTLAIDGGRATTADYLMAEVMNISRIGPSITLAPGADPTDGEFDLVLTPASGREKLKRFLLDGVAGEKTRAVLPRKKIRTLHLELTDGEFRLDDQVVLDLRKPRARSKPARVKIDLSIRPQVLEVLVPHAARK